MDYVFVGAGAVAEKYAQSASPHRLRAVCDRDAERATAFARRHDVTAYTAVADLLEAESAPLVVNLTSHAAHAAVSKTCLEAGRHVYSEKPLALDPETAFDLVRQARAADRGLGCAPINHRCDAQRHARSLFADGRLGTVRLATATANVGRVTEWHERPASFLSVGPLYDGGVYPLSLLCAWFGPVDRVRRADAVDAWPTDSKPARSPHVEATLEFVDGPVVSLRTSFYVDHRSREFYGLELHGDDGTLYLDDTGALAADRDAVTVRGGDRPPTVAPHPQPRRERPYMTGPWRLARAIERGGDTRRSARRAAHVVAVCAAIEAAAVQGGSVDVERPSDVAVPEPPRRKPVVRPEGQGTPRLPPVGFGCSRYRDGDYVEPAIDTAVDAGYRLFDSAELYGNETRIGDLLSASGSPDRESLFVVGKPWNTNHGPGHLREACTGSLRELNLDAFDCYALHWPESWAYQGPLRELSSLPVEEQERLTFPTDDDGDLDQADHSLLETWDRMERLSHEGLTRTLGVCNVTLPQLSQLVDHCSVPPRIVQVERHPYRPRHDLVSWCHAQGIRVLAHSPLSAPGLLAEPVLEAVADEVEATPAEVVIAWNRMNGVVPIPSSTEPDHVVSNLAGARLRLDDAQLDRVDGLADPTFSR